MLEQQKQLLIELSQTKMPYGKYKGIDLIDLPEHYVTWYHSKGFPKGKIGTMLGLVYELKLNGLEYMVREIKRQHS